MASIINATIENGFLTITCDGKTLTVDPAQMPAHIVAQAALHGFKQKIVDAAALSRDEETGASATPSQKFYAMSDVFSQISGGDWNKRATGDGSAGRGLLVEALIRVTGNTPEAVEATVKGWDDATQAAMRADPAVAPMIVAIKAERAAKKPAKASGVDVGGLLAGLMAPAVVEGGAEDERANRALRADVKKAKKA